jgi:HD-GYP domain-containing protein (c-di-GMP phosphodiesterase class II)
LKALYFNIKRHKKIDVRHVDDMIHQFIRGFRQGVSPIGLLASLKSADEYTFTHVVNVCILTVSQAEALGFREDHLYQIGIASVLHDAGKLFIPEEILNKPAALTQEERAVIETHPAKGARYILGLQGIPKLAVLGAMEHHIKYNGTGYPKMKGKWKPNIVSQMIAISDVFDAMRSKRPYRGPKPQEEILRVLQDEKGKSFNPQIVENFLKLIKENGKTAC